MAARGGKHTIILIQHNANLATRTYLDFTSVGQAMDAIVKLYEHKLKDLNPNVQHITYDISDLNNFLDGCTDVCALCLDSATQKYEPHDRTWIKEKVYIHLKSQAK